MMKGHELEKTCTEYLECVQSMDGMVKWCTKCNRAGCEKCSYKWALRYVVRWQQPAYWWRTGGGVDENPFMNFIAKRPGGLLAASSERASKKLHVEVDDDEETQ